MGLLQSGKVDMLEVINISGEKVRFQIARNMGESPDEYELEADEVVRLPANYVRQFRIAPGRDPRPSTIDQLTAGRVLWVEDPKAAACWDRAKNAAKAKAKAAPANQPSAAR